MYKYYIYMYITYIYIYIHIYVYIYICIMPLKHCITVKGVFLKDAKFAAGKK